jgi:hypothetical protein
MLAKIEEVFLRILEEKYGKITADDALLCALDAESTAKSVGPFDPSFVHFVQQQADMERLAYLLEKRAAA